MLTDFVQAEPLEGEPASDKTEVRILYDEAFIYVGVICYDRDPSGIVVTDSRRDAGLNDMDSFQTVFLFVVYNDTEGLGDFRVGPQSRSFIVKYTHQFDVLN